MLQINDRIVTHFCPVKGKIRYSKVAQIAMPAKCFQHDAGIWSINSDKERYD